MKLEGLVAAVLVVPLLMASMPAWGAAPVEAIDAAPAEGAPVEGAPVGGAPVEGAPVEPAPVEVAPVEAAPIEAAPVEPAPAAIELPAVEPAPAGRPSVWETLADHRVVLTLADGQTIAGTVLRASEDTLVFARATDGLMITVAADRIAAVHVQARPGNKALRKPETGQPLIILGGILIALGGSLGVATLGVGAGCFEGFGGVCPFISMPLMAGGLATLSLGIPFLASGLRKRKQLRAAHRALEPTLGGLVLPGRSGGVLAVSLRF